MNWTAFERRLGAVLGGLGLFQAGLYSVFSTLFHIETAWNSRFYLILVVYHGLIAAALWSVRSHFKDLEGHPLQKIGLPNLLTLLRLTSLPFLSLVFLLARTRPELGLPLVIAISLTFLTDLLDGFLARSLGLGTQLGKLLDSSTDYVLLLTLTVILGVSGVLAPVLLALILIRLLFQIGGVFWLQVVRNLRFVETTFLGKASLFNLMVLYAVEILVFLRFPGLENSWAFQLLEIVSALMMVVSTIDKAVFFRAKWQQKPLSEE